jgi:hypothetical protein
MARSMARIHIAIWTDPDWLALTPLSQWFYWALLSQGKVSLAGCLDLMPTRWATFARGVTVDDIEAALAELDAHRFIVIDHDTAELVIRTFTQHDVQSSRVTRNTVKGLWTAWLGIMSPTLRKVVVDHIPEDLWEYRDGHDVHIEAPPEALDMRDEPALVLPLERPVRTETDEPCAEDREPAGHAESNGPSERADGTNDDDDDHDDDSDHASSLLPSSVLPGDAVGDRENPASEALTGDRLEQAVRRTANLVGRAITASRSGVDDPAGYAAGVTKGLLDPANPERDDIARMLTEDGLTPEQIAETWLTRDPLGFDRPVEERQPSETDEEIRDRRDRRLAETAEFLDQARTSQRADPATVRAAIAAARPHRHEDTHDAA